MGSSHEHVEVWRQDGYRHVPVGGGYDGLAAVHDLELPLEAGEVGRGVTERVAPLVLIAERHGQLGVDLGQNALVDLAHLLADHGETEAELPPLADDVP